MTQETVSKEDLKQYEAIDTHHTKESLVKEINISGLIVNSLNSLLATLAQGLDFFDVTEDDNKKIIPYAQYIVDTSPYHKNESVNLVSIRLEKKDGQLLGRPMMRLIHKESAEVISTFLNGYGSPQSLTTHTLMERTHNQALHDNLQAFIARMAGSLQYIEADAVYQAFEEYTIVSLVTDSFDVFDIEPKDFIKRLIDSIDDPNDGNDDDDNTSGENGRPHLRVVK